MSIPANPLASYRSYSYYHVLVLCDSSETADSLSLITDEELWRHATYADADDANTFATYDKYSPKSVKLPNNPSSAKGKYCVLIDGATDADITITALDFASATAAAVTALDNNTSIAMEGSIRFSEPRGVSFLDITVRACRSMTVDAAQAVYVVKTFFVGHVYDAESNQEIPGQIVNVEPLKFIAYEITGSFTQNGGEYQMQFACLQHGISRLPQYSKSADSFSMKAGATLATTIEALNTRITANYEKLYHCIESTLQNTPSSNAADLVSRISEVKYSIILDDVYKNDPAYVVSNQAQQQKDGVACNSEAQLSFPAGTSIEDAIHQIMSKCDKVQSDGGQGAQPNQVLQDKKGFKIHSSYKSYVTSAPGQDKVKYEVIYHIKQFTEPKTFNFFRALSNEVRKKEVERNLITFDYIYTGNNIDILDLNISLNQGLAYVQIATMSNSTKEQLASTTVRNTSLGDGSAVSNRFVPTASIPVFFSTDVQSPLFKNLQNTKQGIHSAYTLAKHASIEVAEASMTIMGNPLLLNAVNRVSSSTVLSPATQDTHFADFTNIPAFAKINIKVPRKNDDIALMSAQIATNESNFDYAEDFWFQGYYYVYGVQTTFDSGEFRQVLQMIALPEENLLDNTATDSQIKYDVSTNVDSCYDGKLVQSTSATKPQVTNPPPPVPLDHPVFTVPDSKAMLDKGGYTLDDVVNYTDKASPEVKAAIVSAATSKGLDPVLLARIASHESAGHNFGTNSHNAQSDALGIYQFIPDTWSGSVNLGKVPGIRPNTPAATSLPLRSDPVISSGAMAIFTSDNIASMKRAGVVESDSVTNVYLAHFLGARRASLVIKAIQNNQGNLPLGTIIGSESGAALIVKQNGRALPANPTGNDLEAFAANAMATTIRGGLKVTHPRADPTNVVSQETTQFAAIKAGKTGTQQISNITPNFNAGTAWYTSGKAANNQKARDAVIADLVPRGGRIHETPAQFDARVNEALLKYDADHAGDAASYNASVSRTNYAKINLDAVQAAEIRKTFKDNITRHFNKGTQETVDQFNARVTTEMNAYDKALLSRALPNNQKKCNT